MASPKKSSSWWEMRRALSFKSKTELLNLIRDLYALNLENQGFINARILTSEETLEPSNTIVRSLLDPAVTDRRAILHQLSKVRKSRNQWKHKAVHRSEDNRHLRKELVRVKKERDRYKQALTAAQVRLHLPSSCPDGRLVYLMIVDPSQLQAVREREIAEITVAMEAWVQAFSAEQSEDMLSFYAEDSVLWGILPPLPRYTSEDIRDYLAEVFALMERKVTIINSRIRIYGDTAVNTGYYTFSWIKEGHAETIPARYSITYVKRYQRWLIVDHHSSTIPVPT